MKFLASSALSSSGTGPRCESTRQHINDTTQPKYEFMTEFRVQRKKNTKSKKKSSKKSKNGSLKFAKKRIIYTKEGCPHKKRKSSAFKGVYSQKCKRKSCIQDADRILHTRGRQHTKACIQHTEIQHTKCRQHTKICIQHTNHFKIRNSGARKEPAAIPPNENASIVKATGERVNRKRSTGRAKPVLDPRGYSGTCGAPGRCKT